MFYVNVHFFVFFLYHFQWNHFKQPFEIAIHIDQAVVLVYD